jgi:capsular polysaccharide biosynthesis protein
MALPTRSLSTSAADSAPPELVRASQPPPSALQAVRAHPLLVMLAVAVCVGAGIAAGVARTPIWTAETRLSLGSIDVATQSLPGYVEATRSLAAAYSRAAQSTPVVRAAAATARLAPAQAAHRLSASPVADTSVLRVVGTGPDERSAAAVANAGSDALVRYIRRSTSVNASDAILRDYRRAQDRVQQLTTRRDRQRRQYLAQPSRARRAGLQDVTAALATAQLQADTLGDRFKSNQQDRPSADFVQVLSDATTAASDRTSALQLRAFTGLVAGLLLGLALALWRSRRRATA